ncbi:PIN domain-containing protein [Agromyces italicus]|uniref:PIN domain-containing protein n=1 Tax=Agromyces italicus TaxID=279572 RepID=UPI0003B6AE26|nr:PIN domain-containing protein [Agromyces italicus]
MTNPGGAHLLLDASAAVALVLPSHSAHAAIAARVGRARLGLAGHAAIETYSALTRLPAQHRLSAAEAAQLIADRFASSHPLDAAVAATAVGRLAEAGVTGGSAIDGLVALAAIDAGVALVTCDRRALTTYDALGTVVEYV